ncbi:helix-turn-helix domain-containing protein [Streptosporangium soli]|nr:helix-turn-helix domain-containing protein [Streptosporangium sp. KLBMP 9127]
MNGNLLVARNLRRFRQERQLSLGELARRAGLSKQTLSKLEQGIGNPTVETLVAVGDALDVPLRHLVTEWGTPVYIQREGDGLWERQGGAASRLLDQVYGSGRVHTALIELVKDDGPPEEIPAHPTGTLYHVYVISGRARIGPAGEQVEVAAGDFVRFPGDTVHTQQSLTPKALMHVVTTVPQVPQFGPGGPKAA